MQLFRQLEDVPDDFGPTALTIGNFDGVHRGHRAVLSRIVDYAKNHGQQAVAVTFEPHPATVHRPGEGPRQITGLDERLRRMSQTGLDGVLVQQYTLELAKQSPEDYVKSVFVDALGAATVVVGRDVRFGWQNSGDLQTMRRLGEKYGFSVKVVDDIRAPSAGDDAPERFSSSSIRDVLESGDVETAAEMLGSAHVVTGTVVHGEARGRDLGFPTANIGPDAHGLVPADGVYAGWLVTGEPGETGKSGETGEAEHRHPAAISVGNNPTFDKVVRRVEAHVIDRHDECVDDFDLYGRNVRIEFVARLRGMVTYRGMGPLIEQMKQDVDDARAVLA